CRGVLQPKATPLCTRLPHPGTGLGYTPRRRCPSGSVTTQKNTSDCSHFLTQPNTVFTVVASWEVDGEAIEEEFALPVDGSVVAGPQDLPVGTVVSFDEIDVPDLDGFTFTGAEFSSESLEISAGESQ